MTAGWESLGDWLHDQARELGHLVKPRPRPVGVPSLDDMPDLNRVPMCEEGLIEKTHIPCEQPAVYIASNQHTWASCGCKAVTALLCQQHRDRRVDWAHRYPRPNLVCDACGGPMKVPTDLVPWERPL